MGYQAQRSSILATVTSESKNSSNFIDSAISSYSSNVTTVSGTTFKPENTTTVFGDLLSTIDELEHKILKCRRLVM